MRERENKGFGKADRLLNKVAFEQKVREAERRATEIKDWRSLSQEDWLYLTRDAATLVGVFVAEEDDYTFGGTSLRDKLAGISLSAGDGSDGANGVILLVAATGSEPPFECVGALEGPNWSGPTDELVAKANDLLSQEGFAFTARWKDTKGRHHLLADYGVSPAHCSQKAQAYAEGGELSTPVAVSRHPSVGSALTFAHSLNKSTGTLFGGVPYSLIGTVTKGETDE